ncbi:MAG: SDR family oxidoreductase [Psychromonas sp.]|nr:SDR family oxidoreductase [Alteromonadales bacterium]MCP5076961.1 SDR family oxidoreductase [Psychromonas sp.]
MNNVVLITGASAGLGEEFAIQLAKQGYHLLLVARRVDKLNSLQQQLSESYPQKKFLTLPLDLNELHASEQLFEFISNQNIQLCGLINNAGFGVRGRFETLPLSRQHELLQVNITALTQITHRLINNLKRGKQSFIINVASTAAFQAGPNLALYYASKAFVLSFTEALHEELKGDVLVSALCPGATRTEFADVANISSSLAFRLRVMEKEPVVAYALKHRGRAIIIPGLMNKIGVVAVKLLPRTISRKLAFQIQK